MNLLSIITPSRQKIEALGFEFENVEVIDNVWEVGGKFLRGVIKCPCGKREIFTSHLYFKRFIYEEIEEIYEVLYKNNFNEKHLRADGFPEEFIQSCKLKYEEQTIKNGIS